MAQQTFSAGTTGNASASLGWQGTSATSALPTTGTSPSQEILVAEMEKAADAADTSVLFFSAGANF